MRTFKTTKVRLTASPVVAGCTSQKCSTLNETASKGITALGKNCRLLCNLCVSGKRDKIATIQWNECQNNTQMEHLESELFELKRNFR